MERLTNRFDDGEAFIPNFVSQLYGIGKVAEKLAYYEDLEEQGLLVKLPCPFGTKIYCIHNGFIEEGMFFEMSCFKFKDYYKKSWFLTKEEAEQELKKMGE